MPKLKKSAVSTPVYTADDYGRMAAEYDNLSAQIKTLEARKKELSAQIKEGAEKFGAKDDKGSFYFENNGFIMGKVAKKSLSIDQEKGVDILERMGLGDCIDTVTIRSVNEDKLSAAVSNGRISINKVEEFVNSNISYSVSVKECETVTAEVEQTTLKAARRK